jgi:hypothetical protein
MMSRRLTEILYADLEAVPRWMAVEKEFQCHA